MPVFSSACAQSASKTPCSRAPALLVQRTCDCASAPAAAHVPCDECAAKHGAQTKLAVSEPGDALEREADRVADDVLADTKPVAIAGTAPAESSAQRSTTTGSERDAPVRLPLGGGRALPNPLRRDMERRFQADFSGVRVHADAAASASARALNAHAYTIGNDIVFGPGRFATETGAGRRLVAHELTHVVQQSRGTPAAIQRQSAPGKTPTLTIGSVDVKSTDPNCAYGPGEEARANRPEGILPNDIDRAEFFGAQPADAVVIADFKVDDGELRPATAAIFRRFWLPTFDKTTLDTLEIVGYNDCVGWESRNSALRRGRAEAVGRLLPGVSTRSAGFEEYLVPNTSEQSRATNRAVIIKPKPGKPPPPPPPPKHEETITLNEPPSKDCTKDQRTKLAVAFPAAKLMAERARAAVTRRDKGTVVTFLLERYFGADALAHVPEIAAGYSKILGNWKNWELEFDCEVKSADDCKNSDPHKITLAYVMSKRHIFSANQSYGVVHVCQEAFNFDMQQLSATVLHELSHRLDNTSDKGYCEASSGYCSALSAEAAIDNADSYAQFARELFNAML
ncbi:MAG: DUF4157 domain-containing protein [Vulcanimicrobiaceae bacterium]